MDKKIGQLIAEWKRRNITGIFCPDRHAALAQGLEMIPRSASVGLSGSVTLNELGIVAKLEERGNRVFNQYRSGLSRGEGLELRRQGAAADYFLTGANAIAESGELVFFSAWGHRIAGISCARSVIVFSGINKLVPTAADAHRRVREYTTPLNCKRLNFVTPCVNDGVCRETVCRFPEYRRMCCQVLTIEAEIEPQRLTVVLINEPLGL